MPSEMRFLARFTRQGLNRRRLRWAPRIPKARIIDATIRLLRSVLEAQRAVAGWTALEFDTTTTWLSPIWWRPETRSSPPRRRSITWLDISQTWNQAIVRTGRTK